MKTNIKRPAWFYNKELKTLQYGLKKNFKDHKATIIINNEDVFIMEWRNKNGSSNYYIKYVLDKKLGVFMVYGDLGESIAYWYSPLEVTDITSYMYDIWYYKGKIKTGDVYTRYYDDIEYDLKEYLKECFGKEKLNEKEKKEYEAIDEYIEYGEYDEYSLHEQLVDYIEEEILGDIGLRLNQRVYLWAAGFLLACEQLEIIKLVD